MSLIKPPEILRGVKVSYNPDTYKWELPNDASPEQVEAYSECHRRIEQARRDMCIIGD